MINTRSSANLKTIHISGGLGNQLFQYAYGKYLTQLGQLIKFEYGVLPYRSDDQDKPWIESIRNVNDSLSKTKFLKRIYFRILISLSLRAKKYLRIKTDSAHNSNVTRIGRFIFVHEIGYCSELLGIIEEEIFGYFQCFNFAPTLKDLPLPIDLELKAKAEEEKPLVVHVRLGDYRENPQLGLLPFRYYEIAINAACAIYPYGSIWLFSDNPLEAIKMIPEEFTHLIRILDLPGESPTATLSKMRYGHGYVLANSSLSWWGAFLTYNKNAAVFAPKPWFRQISEPANLRPEKWEAIELDWS